MQRKKKAAVKLSYSVSFHGTYTDLHLISSFNMHLLDTVGKKVFLFSLKSGELCKLASAVDTAQMKLEQKNQEENMLLNG